MSSLAGYQLIRKVHCQPPTEILLCSSSSNPEGTENPVIVKQINLAQGATDKVDPTNESATVQKLLQLPAHANILTHRSVINQPKALYITMDYCPRGDLLSWLQQQPNGRLPEQRALAIFVQILHGVRFLHSHDIAHCDLSLENFLLADDETIKICDFGLATRASSPSNQHVGKVEYMAPEVVRGDVYDPVQADVWSLGIVLFMLLTGSPLFRAARPDETAFKCIQSAGIRGILENWDLADEISNETAELLAGMLRVDFAERFRNVETVLEHLPATVDAPAW